MSTIIHAARSATLFAVLAAAASCRDMPTAVGAPDPARAVPAGPAAAGPASPVSAVTYGAIAWGTRVVGGTGDLEASSGPTALSTLGTCSMGGASASLAAVDLLPAGVTGAIRTRADTLHFADGTGVRARSEAAGVALLGGRITADLLTAVSTVSFRDGEFHADDAGTAFVGLRIDGRTVTATARNARVTLAGVGEVVLNQQGRRVTDGEARLAITLIRVLVREPNTLGLPVGADVELVRATSTLALGTTRAALRGAAHGAVVAGGPVASGPHALVNLPCGGTDGRTRTGTVSSITVAGILSTGAVVSTAEGVADADRPLAVTTSTVGSVDLLDGLVRADEVRARASLEGGRVSDAGSGFLGLQVAGRAITGDVAPNTRIHLEGLGTLWLRRVTGRDDFIHVRMLELVLEPGNRLGWTAGTTLRVGVAQVGLR
jgi:hypothetical protein